MLKKRWMWIVVIVYILLIFHNSLQTADASNGMSGPITLFVMKVLSVFHIDSDFHTAHHIIRKLAHFSEFFLLSVLVQTASYYQPIGKKPYLIIILLMILVPLCDEGIQLFVDGRAGSLKDALLDMSGYLTAWIFGSLIRKKKTE